MTDIVSGLQDKCTCHECSVTFFKCHRAVLGLVSHLLVGGSASGHQHDVETSESSHWDEEQASYAHDRQSEKPQLRRSPARNLIKSPKLDAKPKPESQPEPKPSTESIPGPETQQPKARKMQQGQLCKGGHEGYVTMACSRSMFR